MKRLFIAIKLDPEENLLKSYQSIRQVFKGELIRWVEPDKFHITLKFLGDTYVDSIPIVNDIINSVVSTESSFNIDIKNTGIFGSSYDPRVIWFGVEKNPSMINIANGIIEELDLSGFKKDRQNFVPHLTIGRIKMLTNKKWFNERILDFKDIHLQSSTVKRIILYESILTKKGPIYKEINSFLLKS